MSARESLGPFAFAAGTTLLVAGATSYAFAIERAGTALSFATLAAPYVVLSAVAVARMRRRHEMFLLRPRGGDLTFGALVAFLLYGIAFAFHALVTSHGQPNSGWIIQVYLRLGDPLAETRHAVALGVAAIGMLEELTWRGLVTPVLEERLGALRGAALSTVSWAAAHLPTVWLLADPAAGPNPLLVLAALGCGAAWSYLRWRMERLVPVLLSHGLFSWAIVEFPLWTPFGG
jgi:hypothetical protein